MFFQTSTVSTVKYKEKNGWCIIFWCQRCQRHHQLINQYLYWNIFFMFFQTSTVSTVEYKKNKWLMFNFLLSMVSMAPSANRPASLLKYFSSCFFKRQRCQLWNTNKNGWCIIFGFMSFWKKCQHINSINSKHLNLHKMLFLQYFTIDTVDVWKNLKNNISKEILV